MVDTELLLVYGDVQYIVTRESSKWKQGFLRFYVSSKNGRIYCELWNSNARKPIREFKIRREMKICPRWVNGGTGQINITLKDKEGIFVRKNFATNKGSFELLFELLSSIRDNGEAATLKKRNIVLPVQNSTSSTILSSDISSSSLTPAVTASSIRNEDRKKPLMLSLTAEQMEFVFNNTEEPQPRRVPLQTSLTPGKKLPLGGEQNDNVSAKCSFSSTPSKPPIHKGSKHKKNAQAKEISPKSFYSKKELLSIFEEEDIELISLYSEGSDKNSKLKSDYFTPMKSAQSTDTAKKLSFSNVDQISSKPKPVQSCSLSQIMTDVNFPGKSPSNGTFQQQPKVNTPKSDKISSDTSDRSRLSNSVSYPGECSTPSKSNPVANNSSTFGVGDLDTSVDFLSSNNSSSFHKSVRGYSCFDIIRIRANKTSPAKETALCSSFYSETNSRSPLKALNFNNNQHRQKRPLLSSLHTSPKNSKRLKSSPENNNENATNRSPDRRRFYNTRDNNVTVTSEETVGLSNVGNSCYMNAVLQCLLHIPCFTDDLRTAYSVIEDKLPELSITRSLMSLMSAIQNQKHVDRSLLTEFNTTVCSVSKFFKIGRQTDAQEFLGEILHQLGEESKSIRDPVQNNFAFELYSSYECLGCGYVSHKKEVQLMLSVDVPPKDAKSTLDFSLDNYFSSQNLEIKCRSCESTKATGRQKISSLPRVLVMHLKRYFYDGLSKKVERAVAVPLFVSLEKHVEGRPTVNVPSRKMNESASSRVGKNGSPRKKASPYRLVLRSSFRNQTAKNPVGLKGGLPVADVARKSVGVTYVDDSFDSETTEQEHDIDKMTEEEQMARALRNSIETAQFTEDKILLEVMEKSLNESISRKTLDLDDDKDDLVEGVCLEECLYEELDNASRENIYKLVGITCHQGSSVDSGHYISYIKSCKANAWFEFNDERVYETNLANVFANSKRDGYLFFYVAREILNAP